MQTKKREKEMISRRKMLRLLGAGSAGLALAACAPPAAPAQPAAPAAPAAEPTKQEAAKDAPTAAPAAASESGEVKVLICCSSGQEETDLRTKWNTEFEKKHEGIKITQESPPGGTNYFEKLQTLIAANTPPDLFDMWEGYVQPYAENGALADLEPHLASDTKIKKSDIVPGAIDAGSYQGKVYSMLYGFMPGPVSLYYNPAHFEKAGIPEPTATWKWDDMKDAAKKLTVDSNGDGVPEQWGFAFSSWFVNWLYTIWSNGSDIFSADQTKSTLTDPKTVEPIQYWADLVAKDKVAPDASAMEVLKGNIPAFKGGQISMVLGNYWDVGDLKSAKDFKWKAVLAPTANNGNRTWYMHTGCWSISPGSKFQNTGWEFIRDFTLESPIESLVPYIPPLASMQLKFFDVPLHKELGYGALADVITKPGVLRIPGAGAKFDKIQGMIQAEIDQVVAGKKSAADAMAAAAPLVDGELSRQ